MIVEDSHPEGIMGIYDPSGGLQRIVIFRDANPNAEEVRQARSSTRSRITSG